MDLVQLPLLLMLTRLTWMLPFISIQDAPLLGSLLVGTPPVGYPLGGSPLGSGGCLPFRGGSPCRYRQLGIGNLSMLQQILQLGLELRRTPLCIQDLLLVMVLLIQVLLQDQLPLVLTLLLVLRLDGMCRKQEKGELIGNVQIIGKKRFRWRNQYMHIYIMHYLHLDERKAIYRTDHGFGQTNSLNRAAPHTGQSQQQQKDG